MGYSRYYLLLVDFMTFSCYKYNSSGFTVSSLPCGALKSLTSDSEVRCLHNLYASLLVTTIPRHETCNLIIIDSSQFITHCTPYSGIYGPGYIFLYTVAPLDHGQLVSITSSFSQISQKLINLQLCSIYH